MAKKKKEAPLTPPKTLSTPEQGYTVVVPIFDDEQAEWLINTALHLAGSHKGGRVVVVGMVLVPETESLSYGTKQAQNTRATLETLQDKFKKHPIYFKPRIRVDYHPWRPLAKVTAKENADMVILPWRKNGGEQLFALSVDKLFGHFGCHVLIVSGNTPKKPKKVLLPIRGTQEAPLMLKVALAIANAYDAQVTMLYALDEDPNPASKKMYRELARISQGNPHITELRVEGSALPAILSQARQHDILVLGASEAAPGHSAQAIGQIPRHIKGQQDIPLLVVRTHQPPPLEQITRWNRTEPLPATTTSVLVEKWFAENTFSSREFKGLKRLVAMKERQGLTISLGLPALNEEETIGNIIKTIKNRLMTKVPLLDEIVLIDSGSTDYTVDIAMDHGIPVYQHSEILPQHGSFRGKGEALWKSLHVLKGDIVAWIDTDIVNIHPRFVYGILGPLLSRSSVQYVKGFYRRPLKVGKTMQAGGGGRVTELVARPMFNLFYPELSGLLQPLSGEYAGRRTALEQMPFYVGYGVETGLLLNLVEKYGINGIAQVDLRQRIHHNQSLSALSRMAFAIIQVFIDHLEQRQRVDLLSDVNRTMKIIRHNTDTYFLEEHPISDTRRPPMISLAEYRDRRGITGWNDPTGQSDDTPEEVAA